ncbi:hypothetical protein L2D14_02510 [Thalassospiraceae bacterium LMO-JJ14]|nr:hypothetical protein L2D14_02510 [Thalassospiraceae bacterium LMO-JJ14]
MSDVKNGYAELLGARILSEANDLKRTPDALAGEIGISAETLSNIISGAAGASAAADILHKMSRTYPVSIADLWLDDDDTNDGVRVMRAAESEASSRVFDRDDRNGDKTPYYEYRDTAMSRLGPFKPEWIKELRTVSDNDPYNPDVAYNHGHLMHQCTFFIGAVNFYYEIRGKRYCCEMNTGDSNYITPYVPHSFASRDPDNPGLIIAVTYGGSLRRCLGEFARMDSDTAAHFAGDLRNPEIRLNLLHRRLAAEMLDLQTFRTKLLDCGMDGDTVNAILETGDIPAAQLKQVADILNVRAADLMSELMTPEQEVVISYARDAEWRNYPASNEPAYRIAPLARTPHQSNLKGFDLKIMNQGGAELIHSGHQYIYNYGETPAAIRWADGLEETLETGDSAYIRPGVSHSFAQTGNDSQAAELCVLRVPGLMTDEVFAEFAAYNPDQRDRLFFETKVWF